MASDTGTTAPDTAGTPDGADNAGGGPAAPGRPATKTVRDMMLSMAVIMAGVLVLFLVQPFENPGGRAVPTVDFQVEANTAARAAPYRLLVPEPLPEGWRPTSARYDRDGEYGATWRLNLTDEDEQYAALAQADGPAEPFVAWLTEEARATGESRTVGSREWAVHAGDKYHALVSLAGPGSPDAPVTVLTGTVSPDRLAELAAALVPHRPPAA
ncbi:DUF4245 domain-containing protein [Streptomyces sp. YIM 98790]|uniref:DUF4245 domain-containing protein n=1 Tax=Streptomyces sp. YIM 98790 TaxID=2689077 RepID=UPI0028BD1E38|nr:DUF4245 domain-containing protein [Streptomyces sp. YIM 98790]